MIQKNLIALICFGIALVVFSCNAPAQKNEAKNSTVEKPELTDTEAIDKLVDGFVDKGLFPFIYIRLEHLDGTVMYEHSAVNRDIIPDLTIDKDRWIRIWSMSKIVTISMVLDLVEDGLLKLDDPVTKYIPEFKNLEVATLEDGRNLSDLKWKDRALGCPYKLVPMESEMTIWHLINHQAGFYYAVTGYACLDSLAASKNLPQSKNTQEFIDKIASLPLVQQPGTNDFYGTNTTILGFVAERATGKSLKQLIEERVTGPLKIQGLQYTLADASQLPPAVSGKDTILRKAHVGELDIFGPTVPDYDPAHELYLGGEGMVATADGYADFVRMLVAHGELNGYRFLNQATVEDIYAPHSQLESPYGHNGYNLWVPSDSIRMKGHGDKGIWIGGGYESTHFWADPERKFVGVIMSQMYATQPGGWQRDNAIRGAIYKQLWEQDKK